MKIWLVITALSWNGALHVERIEMATLKECTTRCVAHASAVNSRGSTKVSFACWKNAA